jgi:hypothetical protein
MAAATISAQLAGSRGERATAYAALEAARDVTIELSACVEPLCAVLGRPAAETDE